MRHHRGSDDPPTKQDDIFAMADTFGSNCGGKYALTSGIPSIQDFGMYGVELMNKDHTEFTFNNAKGVEFVQHYIDMYNAGASPMTCSTAPPRVSPRASTVEPRRL